MYSLPKIITTIFLIYSVVSCKKYIEVDPPIDSITTEQMFKSDKQAEWAIAGIYSKMINGTESYLNPAFKQFYAGLSNIAGGLSSDELINTVGVGEPDQYVLYTNNLNVQNASVPTAIWTSAYNTIYDINAALEGIAASTSASFTDSARALLTGEAKALRAFAYFYLTNFFGDLPLVLTVDFNVTKNLARSPQSKIYDQIIKDLTEARESLPEDFSNQQGQRIRINKWFAEGLLARVYLYLGRYDDAIASSTAVIDNPLFRILQNLNDVFLSNSEETIWQLANARDVMGTPEGETFIPALSVYQAKYHFSDDLLNSFEVNDQRRVDWVNSSQIDPSEPIYYYPYKYKTGSDAGPAVEYYTVMRLAELYLIRAEATILSNPGNTHSAIADLNALRYRAGLDDLPLTLTSQEVIDAVAHERRVELFAEGAHRWFDLKRTGKASQVLSAVNYKQPWRGDFQLLYPIPVEEILADINLTQNPEYSNY